MNKNKKIIFILTFFIAMIVFSGSASYASAATCESIEIRGKCQVACSVNQDEILPPIVSDCGEMKCCVDKTVPLAMSGEPVSKPAASGEPNSNSSSMGGIKIPDNTGLADPVGGIAAILKNLLTWLLGIVGVIALIGFVISGIQYIIATGNEDMMGFAKKNMMYSIIGIAVALGAVVIVKAIDLALQAKSF